MIALAYAPSVMSSMTTDMASEIISATLQQEKKTQNAIEFSVRQMSTSFGQTGRLDAALEWLNDKLPEKVE